MRRGRRSFHPDGLVRTRGDRRHNHSPSHGPQRTICASPRHRHGCAHRGDEVWRRHPPDRVGDQARLHSGRARRSARVDDKPRALRSFRCEHWARARQSAPLLKSMTTGTLAGTRELAGRCIRPSSVSRRRMRGRACACPVRPRSVLLERVGVAVHIGAAGLVVGAYGGVCSRTSSHALALALATHVALIVSSCVRAGAFRKKQS